MSRRRLGATVVAVSAVLLIAGPEAARASTCNYTGAAGGSWHVAGNWLCDNVPSADADGIPDADDAVVLASGDNVAVTSADAAADSLNADGGATLQVAATRTLTVDSAATFGNAIVSGAGAVAVTGAFTKMTTATLSVSGVAMTLTAPSTWSDGTICLNDAATFGVSAALAVQADADNVQHCSGATGRFLIAPTGAFNVAGGDRFINTTFDNDGLFNLAAGTLSYSGPSLDTHAGHFAIDAAALFSPNTTMALSAAGVIDGVGTLRTVGGSLTVPDGATLDPATTDLQGGTLTIDGTAPATSLDTVILRGGTLNGGRNRTLSIFDARNGTLGGANTTTVNGAFAKTTTGTVNLSALTFVPTIDSTWADGTICLNDAATFQLDDALDVQADADNVQHCSGAAGRFVISPTGAFNVAGGDRFINTIFDNDGLVDLLAGNLSYSGTSLDTHAGHFAIAGPATFSPNSTMARRSTPVRPTSPAAR
jgi:hypothetical protein